MSPLATLTGQLMFFGDGYHEIEKPYVPRPWNLIQANGDEVDIRPIIMDALRAMDGKPAKQGEQEDSYSILLDDDSPLRVEHYEGHPLLRSESAMTNIHAHLTNSLVRLTMRMVTIGIDENGLTIQADSSEEIYRVGGCGDGKNPSIPRADAVRVCGFGSMDNRCIFSRGDDSLESHSCVKFTGYEGLYSLDQHALGKFRRSRRRVGNCGLVIRKKEERETTQP